MQSALMGGTVGVTGALAVQVVSSAAEGIIDPASRGWGDQAGIGIVLLMFVARLLGAAQPACIIVGVHARDGS